MGDLIVLSELKKHFSEFDQIAEITALLAKDIEEVNKYNKDAAGDDDAIAKAYHRQVDEGTKRLSERVDSIGMMFNLTGQNGNDATKIFDAGEDDSTRLAQDWNH